MNLKPDLIFYYQKFQIKCIIVFVLWFIHCYLSSHPSVWYHPLSFWRHSSVLVNISGHWRTWPLSKAQSIKFILSGPFKLYHFQVSQRLYPPLKLKVPSPSRQIFISLPPPSSNSCPWRFSCESMTSFRRNYNNYWQIKLANQGKMWILPTIIWTLFPMILPFLHIPIHIKANTFICTSERWTCQVDSS